MKGKLTGGTTLTVDAEGMFGAQEASASSQWSQIQSTRVTLLCRVPLPFLWGPGQAALLKTLPSAQETVSPGHFVQNQLYLPQSILRNYCLLLTTAF